jgi:predicted DNA-binding transcriptional regulator YafY
MRLEKTAQLLELARRLASSAEGMTLDEMSEALGVSRRTAERMRDAVAVLFPQIQEIAEGRMKRFRIPGGLDGFFNAPTTDELGTLALASRTFRDEGSHVRASHLENLETKIRAAMRASVLNRLVPDVEALVRAECVAVQAGPRPYEDETLLASIRMALIAMKRVRFVYRGGSSPGRTRSVIPYGLMFGRANYLVGVEQAGQTPKHWRLDRIEDLTISDEVGAAPDSFDLAAHAASSFGVYQDGAEDVVLKVGPDGVADAASWRFHPNQTVEKTDDGSLIVRFRASGMLELAWHLFSWSGRISVIAPERLKTVLREELSKLNAAYG